MTIIKHKRGTGIPAVTELEVGELAIDTLAVKLYTKIGNAVVELGGGSSDGGSPVHIGDTAPSDPAEGDLWYDTSSDTLFLFDGTYWFSTEPCDSSGIEEAPEDGIQYARKDAAWEPVSAVHVGDDEPANPSAGQLWYKPTDNEMYVYDGSGWQSFGSGGGEGGGGGSSMGEAFLIVAGGGAGGANYAGGGGGAGGYLLYDLKEGDLPDGQKLQITVGAGGLGNPPAISGTDSYITQTNGAGKYWGANGGGAGASLDSTVGQPGGSGGGSSYRPGGGGAAVLTGKNGSPDCIGHAGSGKVESGVGSGGGGAKEPGYDASPVGSGRGGDGLPCDITGKEVYYAGGGAGGNQPNYGGPSEDSLGGGGYNKPGVDGLGGGGGGTNTANGYGFNGGDGVVIIRTKKSGTATSGNPDITKDGDYNIYSFTSSGAIEF